MSRILDRLSGWGLLVGSLAPLLEKVEGARPENVLPLLCELGALEGGLSVALDVRPDEAIGALCLAISGGAKRLRVEDVRDRPEPELLVRFGSGTTERWSVPDVRALVHNLNDLFRDDPAARAVVDLGDRDDAQQLWCVGKQLLPGLLRERFFAPQNERQLRSLLGERD
ncbi:MAG: hypothetical protein M3Y59_14545 [Myxococcota bacterium]|nr:hypothetical protein [Myxococcota bacterium]